MGVVPGASLPLGGKATADNEEDEKRAAPSGQPAKSVGSAFGGADQKQANNNDSGNKHSQPIETIAEANQEGVKSEQTAINHNRGNEQQD